MNVSSRDLNSKMLCVAENLKKKEGTDVVSLDVLKNNPSVLISGIGVPSMHISVIGTSSCLKPFGDNLVNGPIFGT